MTNLPAIRKSSTLSPCRADLAAAVDAALSDIRLERGRWVTTRPVPDAAREAGEARLVELAEALAPAGEDAAREIIAGLEAVLITAGRTPDSIEAAARVFVRIVSECPVVGLRAAAGDFARGYAGQGRFMPTAAELAALARAKAAPWRAEQDKLRRALAAGLASVSPSADEKDRASRLARDHPRVTEAAAVVKQVLASAVLRNEAARDYRPAPEKPRERTEAELAAHYAANPLQPSETIAAMTGKRGA